MKIERVMRHPISTHDVFVMICAHEFHERKCVDAGALSWHVAIDTDGDATVVRTRRKLPTTGFPSLLRKVVPSAVTSTETITWGPAESDGSRLARLHVDFHGAPARMAGTIHLAPHADGAQVLVDADFTSHVPLVGRRVEKLAAPIILSVIDAEEATGKAWVADAV